MTLTARRMTATEFSAALNQVGLGMREFAALTGANERSVERWLEGQQDIPPWVPIMCALFTLPGATALARAIMQERN